MPIIKRWKNNNAECAIWKIDEEESFFNTQTGLISEKIHPVKRIEHLAARYLLKQLAPKIDLHKIKVHHNGKPFVPNSDLCFSLSHSYPYVAATVANFQPLGIDIQIFREKILRIQHKFLSEAEQSFCKNDIQKLTVAWSAKEAAFKYYEQEGLDYIQHLPIVDFSMQDKNNALINISLQKSLPAKLITIVANTTEDYACASVVVN